MAQPNNAVINQNKTKAELDSDYKSGHRIATVGGGAIALGNTLQLGAAALYGGAVPLLAGGPGTFGTAVIAGTLMYGAGALLTAGGSAFGKKGIDMMRAVNKKRAPNANDSYHLPKSGLAALSPTTQVATIANIVLAAVPVARVSGAARLLFPGRATAQVARKVAAANITTRMTKAATSPTTKNVVVNAAKRYLLPNSDLKKVATYQLIEGTTNKLTAPHGISPEIAVPSHLYLTPKTPTYKQQTIPTPVNPSKK